MLRKYEDCEEICDGNSEFERNINQQSNRPFQVCELIPTPKCQMTPCPVDATFVGMQIIVAMKQLLWDVPFIHYPLTPLYQQTLLGGLGGIM